MYWIYWLLLTVISVQFQHMRTGKPLSCESTIPADDPAWSKPSPILGQPQPIPPRNEPLLYISGAVQVAQEKQPVIHQKTRDTERGKHTRTGKPLSCESTIPADDSDWSKPSPIPGQPQPIPPRNERHYEPLLYISGVVQVAQETQPAIHHKTHDHDAERGKHTYTDLTFLCLLRVFTLTAGLRLTNRRMVCKRLKEPVNVKGHIYRSYCRFPAL